MKYCTQVKKVAVSYDKTTNQLTRLRCKKWSCPYCAWVNRAVWLKRIFQYIESDGQEIDWYFITLTASSKDHKAHSTIDAMQSHLSKLIKRMRRANHYDDMPYIRVYEKHDSGEYHAHMLIQWSLKKDWDDYNAKREKRKPRKWSPKTWLKTNAKECGLGYMADWQKVEVKYDADFMDKNGNRPNPTEQGTRQVVMYIMKYMTKENMDIVESEKGANVRMIQASQHIKPLQQEKTQDWQVLGDYSVTDWFIDDRNMLDLQIDRQLQPSDFNSDRYTHEKTIEEKYGDD
jgi:glutaredoxin